MKNTIAPLSLACILIAGCSTPGIVQQKYSGAVYQGSQAQKGQNVTQATILSIREITIQDKPGVAGATVGAGIGALAVLGFAGTGGNPYGLAAGAIAAAFAGGAATDYAATQMNKTPGFEFTVRMSNGNLMTIAQSNIDSMAIGDKVFVTQSADGVFRIYK